MARFEGNTRRPYLLRKAAVDRRGLTFPSERHFKLEVVEKTIWFNKDDPIATIEGTFKNDPFNAILNCIYTDAQSNVHMIAIQKRTIGRLMFDYETLPDYDFNAVIQGGAVYDQEGLLELRQVSQP